MHSKIIIYSKAKNAHHASAYLSYLFDMKKQFFVGKKTHQGNLDHDPGQSGWYYFVGNMAYPHP